jgi:putative sterol carrier protein
VLPKFLTAEWIEALTAALAAHEGFKSAIANAQLSLQFEVPDAPEGAEKVYMIAIDGGVARVTPGPGESPDITISSSYETAAALAKGELNTQMAFMTGKIKVSGNMGKLKMNQAMLGQFTEATKGMPVEY